MSSLGFHAEHARTPRYRAPHRQVQRSTTEEPQLYTSVQAPSSATSSSPISQTAQQHNGPQRAYRRTIPSRTTGSKISPTEFNRADDGLNKLTLGGGGGSQQRVINPLPPRQYGFGGGGGLSSSAASAVSFVSPTPGTIEMVEDMDAEPVKIISSLGEGAAAPLQDHTSDIAELKRGLDELRLSVSLLQTETQTLRSQNRANLAEFDNFKKDVGLADGAIAAAKDLERSFHETSEDMRNALKELEGRFMTSRDDFDRLMGRVQGLQHSVDSISDSSYWFFGTVGEEEVRIQFEEPDDSGESRVCKTGETLLLFPPWNSDGEGASLNVSCHCRILQSNGQSRMGTVQVVRNGELVVKNFRLDDCTCNKM